jgi:sRNA-binding carbon storage regulator CsrA
MGVLAIKLNRGGFFEIETGLGLVRVEVVEVSSSAVKLGVDAPTCMNVNRDKVLAKRAQMRSQVREGDTYGSN